MRGSIVGEQVRADRLLAAAGVFLMFEGSALIAVVAWCEWSIVSPAQLAAASIARHSAR